MSARSLLRRQSSLVAVLLVCLLGLVVITAVDARAEGASGRVRGAITATGSVPDVRVAWFADDWTYLGARTARGGVYSLSLAPGRYHLQFTDLRPSYDTTKLAPADAVVDVEAAATTLRNVRMQRGASIGGTVRAGTKIAGGARVVAASPDERTFETTADRRGNFALGGLPPGSYSVFTYDRKKKWVAPSTYLRNLEGGEYQKTNVRLTQPAGRLLVDLYAGRETYPGRAYLTAVSVRTGQFWTARASGGSVTFEGLASGRYRLQVPGAGTWLGDTFNLAGDVRASRPTFSSARLTRRGAWLTGSVADGRDGTVLAGATVRLIDAHGATLDETSSGADGGFVLDGQLTTQSGLSVVAGPGQYSDYLGVEPHRCSYTTTRVEGLSVVTGVETKVGSVGMQVVAGQSKPQCQESTPTPTPSPTAPTTAVAIP